QEAHRKVFELQRILFAGPTAHTGCFRQPEHLRDLLHRGPVVITPQFGLALCGLHHRTAAQGNRDTDRSAPLDELSYAHDDLHERTNGLVDMYSTPSASNAMTALRS